MRNANRHSRVGVQVDADIIELDQETNGKPK